MTEIGSAAFSGCTALTSIVIPDSVTSIGWSAFYGCTGLTKVVILDGVTSIGWRAFQGCTGLESVVIPGSVTEIDGLAFYGCTALKSVVFENPEGWVVDGNEVSSEDLSDPAVVASLLVDYRIGVWERVTL